MNQPRFFICRHCGNMVSMLRSSGVPIICCGEKMEELVPGAVEAATEKHIPVVEVMDNQVKVTIGSVIHPMIEEHHIEWIYLQTNRGGQRVDLAVDAPPVATFALAEGEKPIAAYEHCNLHGLWKKEL